MTIMVQHGAIIQLAQLLQQVILFQEKDILTIRTSAGDITFTGTIPTSDVEISITDGMANEWNLIGNPYPIIYTRQFWSRCDK